MAEAPASARRFPWRRIAIVLASTISALFLAEIAHRVWRSASGWPYVAEDMRDTFLEAHGFATQFVPLPPGTTAQEPPPGARRNPNGVLDPFLGFDDDAADRNLGVELLIEKQAGNRQAYTVCLLGGSVAAILSTVSPKVLTETLEADPRFAGVDVRISNHARGGFKQPQQLNELVFALALGYRPSAVVNIDGFNDVAMAQDNIERGIHPFYPSHSHWLHVTGLGATDRVTMDHLAEMRDARLGVVRLSKFGLRYGLWRSSVLGTIVQRALRRGLNAAHEAQSAYEARLLVWTADRGVSGPPFEKDERALEIAVEGWAQSSACIQAICNARGIPYLHVLQPTLHDEGAKPMTAEEIEDGYGKDSWVAGVRAGYPLLRARGERLRAEGVNFVDASRLFADVHETLYYDVCHFGKAGNDMLARFVAERFLDRLPATRR